MPPRKDLGAILVDEDVLEPKDLERVPRAKDQPLWSALVAAELATPEQIFRALSARFGVPVVADERLADVTVPDLLKRMLTRYEAVTAGLLPIDVTADGQRATVVMVDPSDEQTLADFLTRAGVPEGRALLARRDAILRAIDRCIGETTAVVTPLAPPRRRQTTPATPAGPPPQPGAQPGPPLGSLGAAALVASPQSPGVASPLQHKSTAAASPGPGSHKSGGPPPPSPSQPQMKAAASPSPPPPPLKSAAPPPSPSQPQMKAVPHDDDITGTVKLDPSLQAELQRLPQRLLQAGPLTPVPKTRPRKPTPPPTPPPPVAQPDERGAAAAAGESALQEALRQEERLSRALVGAVEALAGELEARLMGGAGQGAEMARLSRRVARQLGLGRRAADEIGVAAQLFAVDRQLRHIDGAASADLFAELGWTAAAEGGLVPILRALTAASAGFGRVAPNTPPPTGARIIGAVADYLELGAAATATPDLDTVSQLLRASPAGAAVVDALLRVLELDRGDITPATPTTLPATSILKPAPEPVTQPSPPPPMASAPSSGGRVGDDDEKTVRKPIPRKKEGE